MSASPTIRSLDPAAAPLPDLTRPRVRRLHALTALRFVAAAAIVLTHAAGMQLLPSATFSPFLLAQAVSFFFVLSGFILTYVYPSLDTWNARGRFLLARFARIWPAHIIALLLLILLNTNALGYPSQTTADWLRPFGVNLLMLQSWFPYPWSYFAFNPAAWSISTEFGFYLMFPLLIHRWSRTWWWKLPLAAGAAVLMIALGNRPDVLATARQVSAQLHQVTTVGLVYTHPFARLFEFVLGMSVALLWRRTPAAFHLRRAAGTALELAAVAAVIANMYFAHSLVDAARRVAWIGAGGTQWLEQAGSVCFSFAALIYVMAREEGWISRALSAPLMVLLGEISFSVYLLQDVFFVWYGRHKAHLYAMPTWVAFLVFWAMLLSSAFLVWACAERPLRQWIVRLWPMPGRRGDARDAPRRALEVPGGRTRSLWAPLLDPGPRVMLGGALVVALLVGMIALELWTAVPPHVSRTPDYLAAVERSAPASREIQFGNQFVLAGLRFEDRGDQGVDVIATWQAMRPAVLRYALALYVLGANDQTLAWVDRPQDPDQRSVAEGEMWADVIHLTPAQLAGARDIGLALHLGSDTALAPMDGKRDWGGVRLRVPLPENLASTGAGDPL
jgi:peptidoglycan/LPS O-acetylase OafA/YrhL